MANEHTYHGTEMEIAFLSDIGFHTSKGFSREVLLKNYIRAAKERTEWGNIDKKACVDYATNLIGAV